MTIDAPVIIVINSNEYWCDGCGAQVYQSIDAPRWHDGDECPGGRLHLASDVLRPDEYRLLRTGRNDAEEERPLLDRVVEVLNEAGEPVPLQAIADECDVVTNRVRVVLRGNPALFDYRSGYGGGWVIKEVMVVE